MAIDVLQTMQWTSLCWDESFEKVIDLASILPETGKEYPVILEKNEDFAKDGKAFILWQPPHSELNGWYDKRPSEILKSYVIEGILKSAEKSLNFSFSVIKRSRLTEIFEKVSEETTSPLALIMKQNGVKELQWESAARVLMAEVGGYIYLRGSYCETILEVILKKDDGKLCLYYSATLHGPADYNTRITKYYLNENESELFRKIIKNAEIIEENQSDLPDNGKINGAEYW